MLLRANRHDISFIAATPHLFSTLGTSMSQGRNFADADSTRAVAIVNEAMAKRLWPDESAVERQFRLVTPGVTPESITVIGVAPDLHIFGIPTTRRCRWQRSFPIVMANSPTPLSPSRPRAIQRSSPAPHAPPSANPIPICQCST